MAVGAEPISRSAVAIVAGLLAAALLVLFVLNLSLVSGRLAMPLTNDDVGYIVTGFDRYQQFIGEQPGHILSSLMRDHAPFQSLQAMIAFLIFGVHAWAPYAVSGCLLFLVVVLVWWAAGDLPTGTTIAVLLLVLSSPLSANVVAEFRPDLFWGFLCGWACFLILRPASLQPPLRNQLLVVLAAGAAIYWKPSAVMVTAATIGFASLLSLAHTYLEQLKREKEVRPILWRYALGALALIAVVAPYFGPNANALVEYFNAFLFVGPVFTYSGSALQQANYYLFGPTYPYNPSFLLWVGLGTTIAHALVRPASIIGSTSRYGSSASWLL